jgi:hypothetical protein
MDVQLEKAGLSSGMDRATAAKRSVRERSFIVEFLS